MEKIGTSMIWGWLFSWENMGKSTIHGRFILHGFHQVSSMKMIWLYNWLIFPMGHPLLGESLCFWGNLYNVRPPSDVCWFISPSNYSYKRTINHSYWSYVHQLGYRTGASHCRGFPVWWHRMVFESTTCLNNTMNVNDMEDRGSQWPVAFDVWYKHTRYTCSTVHVEKTKRLLVKAQGQVQQVVYLSTVMALYQL